MNTYQLVIYFFKPNSRQWNCKKIQFCTSWQYLLNKFIQVSTSTFNVYLSYKKTSSNFVSIYFICCLAFVLNNNYHCHCFAYNPNFSVFFSRVFNCFYVTAYPQIDDPNHFPGLDFFWKFAYKCDWYLLKNWGCLKVWQLRGS